GRKKDLDARQAKLKAEGDKLSGERDALRKEFQDKEQGLVLRKEQLEKELRNKLADLKKQVQSSNGRSDVTAAESVQLQAQRKELAERQAQLQEQEQSW